MKAAQRFTTELPSKEEVLGAVLWEEAYGAQEEFYSTGHKNVVLFNQKHSLLVPFAHRNVHISSTMCTCCTLCFFEDLFIFFLLLLLVHYAARDQIIPLPNSASVIFCHTLTKISHFEYQTAFPTVVETQRTQITQRLYTCGILISADSGKKQLSRVQKTQLISTNSHNFRTNEEQLRNSSITLSK